MGLAFHRQRHEEERKAAETATPAPATTTPVPVPELPANESDQTVAPELDGHTVEFGNGWYRLIGPDGEQVGKSKRSEAEAWAIIEDGDDGGH